MKFFYEPPCQGDLPWITLDGGPQGPIDEGLCELKPQTALFLIAAANAALRAMPEADKVRLRSKIENAEKPNCSPFGTGE